MNDPALHRLLASLDDLVEHHGQRPTDLTADLDLARLRLGGLSRRLGSMAQESAYLRFVGRLVDAARPPSLAASA